MIDEHKQHIAGAAGRRQQSLLAQLCWSRSHLPLSLYAFELFYRRFNIFIYVILYLVIYLCYPASPRKKGRSWNLYTNIFLKKQFVVYGIFVVRNCACVGVAIIITFFHFSHFSWTFTQTSLLTSGQLANMSSDFTFPKYLDQSRTCMKSQAIKCVVLRVAKDPVLTFYEVRNILLQLRRGLMAVQLP